MLNPSKALSEMSRVCKKNGQILLLETGLPDSRLLSWYYRWRQPVLLGKYGKFNVRDWKAIVEKTGLEVLTSKSLKNGSVKLFVIKNNKDND